MLDVRAQGDVQAVADELIAAGAEIRLQVAMIENGRTVAGAAESPGRSRNPPDAASAHSPTTSQPSRP
jgi:hypothetical protein